MITVLHYKISPIRILLQVIITASFILWPNCVKASDTEFTAAQSFGLNYGFRCMEVGDIDADGDIDVVTCNAGKPHLIYKNDGTGVFTISTFGDGNDYSNSIAIGDLDSDNDLDIVLGGISEPNKVYINQGRGDLVVGASFGENHYSVESIVLGDMDGDSDLDIVTGMSAQRSIVYFNDGKGNYAEAKPFGEPASTYFVTLGDLDGDADLDIVAANLGADMIYYNDGKGEFTKSLAFNDVPFYNHVTSIVIGDIDNDGDLDLITGNPGRQNLIYVNDGKGNFSITVPFGPVWSQTSCISIGDINFDGYLDIVVGTRYGGADSVGVSMAYLNDGKGNFITAIPIGDASNEVLNVALFDANGDGGIDVVFNNASAPYELFVNNGLGNFSVSRAFGIGKEEGTLSLGDVDNDNDLDAIIDRTVYFNDGKGNYTASSIFGNVSEGPVNPVLGDVDNDSDLDIVGQGVVHLNNGYGNFIHVLPFSTAPDSDTYAALGDIDGDDDLDYIERKVYLNDSNGNFTEFPSTGISKTVRNLGDMDGDSDLDIVTDDGVFFNNGNGEFTAFAPAKIGQIDTHSALGDIDGDGDLDLVSSLTFLKQIHINDGKGNLKFVMYIGSIKDDTTDIILDDIDGDGDLDIITSSVTESNKIYFNDGNYQFNRILSFVSRSLHSGGRAIATGDVDNDGDPDIVATDEQDLSEPPHKVFFNNITDKSSFGNNLPYLMTTFSSNPANIDQYPIPSIGQDQIITLTYKLYDQEGDPARFIRTCYSLNGGDYWQLPIEGQRQAPKVIDITRPSHSNCPYVHNWELNNLGLKLTSRLGVTHTFQWDTFASGFFGQSDNIVFRLEAYPDLRPKRNSVAGPYQRPFTSSTIFPFRARGTQVRVIDQNSSGVPNALVYRLPVEQDLNGFPMGNPATIFRSNNQGYLAGRGELKLGDRLLALAPVPWTPTTTMTWAVGLTNTIHLYYTNGTPTELGLETHISNTNSPTVTQPGVQQLRFSAAHPLILFDLRLALEWDASTDPNQRYLNQLRADLKQASAFLYDFTNGQAALGHITVTQNAEDWGYADVVVQATNRLRPLAVQGGVVTTGTVDLDHPDIIYETGQVRMGATWNRYGEPGQNLGQDWPLALAHELSHYFFFLDDTYLGQNQDDLLIPVDSCVGSVMGDMYDPSGVNTEFLSNPEWSTRCTNTLAQRTLGRSEWETIRQRYPWLHDAPNTGPARMPFDFTTITILDPLTPTTTLPDPIFYLDYSDNSVSSASGRAFLLRADKYIFDLGSPVGGQNRLLVRGARPGDRLCAFDGQRFAYGCEIVESADERLTMKQDTAWAPQIQISPITSTTVSVSVRLDADLGGTLYARLYPEYGEAGPAVLLVRDGILYQGLLQLSQPLLNGHLQLWVEGTEAPNETNPRREAIVAFALGGNLGKGPAIRAGGPAIRAGGPAIRAGGPAIRAGGPLTRSGHAPLVSPDGQMIFFTTDPNSFHEGELYTIQSTAALPPLPPGKLLIGLGYSVIASPNVTQMPNGSVSFQYLGSDALVQGITEAQEQKLTIHAWRAGSGWQALPTLTSAKYNLASAQGVGVGIYALLWGVTQPAITTMTPTVVTNQATSTLSLYGQGFLAPVTLLLTGSNALTIPLAAQIVDSTTLTVVLPPTLPTQAYQVTVINGDGGFVQAPGVLSVMAPQAACFYDRFESGANQWQMSGAWGIVTLGDSSEHAISDSPEGNYNNADLTTMAATAITSQRFNLSLCPQPQLTFRHAYVIAQGQGHQDRAWVEISTDNGASWNALASYSGGGIYPRAFAAIVDQEWRGVPLEPVLLDLGGYQGEVRLRFRLEVDQQVADKGWVIDDIFVQSRMDGTANNKVFLPVIQR